MIKLNFASNQKRALLMNIMCHHEDSVETITKILHKDYAYSSNNFNVQHILHLLPLTNDTKDHFVIVKTHREKR